jgi:trimeric autotransporter adhesin
MYRFCALLVLLVLSIPVGLSITGCQTNVGAYCNGLGYGPLTSQVESITLQPETTGISLSWGQTGQLLTPTANTCKGASSTITKFNYGSSNLYLADVSPTGAVCGGTWNRNSPGGIADFTICTPPAGSSGGTCTSTSCGVVQLSVSASGVSSNPVNVYVHPPITSIAISPNSTVESQCYSQNQPGPVLTPGVNVTVLGPDGIPIPSADVGTVTYTPVTTSIVSINNTSATGTGINGATTANLPGSTVINASVSLSSSGSAAGYFYTCPPVSIGLSITGGTTTNGVTTITAGQPVNINALIKDTNGNPITGLSLDYASTEPQNFAVSGTGQVTANWPGFASINAICQPTTCNPSPIGQIGVFGTGTPVVSNTLKVTSPGKNSNFLWMASTQSQFFSSIDLTTGKPGSPILLPYVPNSMVSDQAGANLYFGSYRELMTYSTSTNALSKQDTSVPGVVLAVSPSGTEIVICDQLRQVIYIYSGSSVTSSIGGVATRATFSPDSKNAYIVGPDSLWVYNVATGWSTYTSATTPPGPTQPTNSCNLDNNTPGSGTFDPFCGPGLALTVPSIGPFVTGSPTTAWGFCPSFTNPSAPVFYPQAASVGVQTDEVAGTDDGNHILGADAVDNNLTDVWVYQSTTEQTAGIPTGPCPAANKPAGQPTTLPITLATTFNQIPLGVTTSEVDQVVASPTSSVAFVTYNSPAATGVLPAYAPSTTVGSPGAVSSVQLSGTAKSPVAGIFSPNATIFFVSTSGDNLVHFIDPSTLTDTQTINPGLVDPSGNPVPVQMMAVRPRSST